MECLLQVQHRTRTTENFTTGVRVDVNFSNSIYSESVLYPFPLPQAPVWKMIQGLLIY